MVTVIRTNGLSLAFGFTYHGDKHLVTWKMPKMLCNILGGIEGYLMR